jgi:hypothetical protein
MTDTPKSTLTDAPFGVVPQNVLRDKSLSTGARFLFSLFCSHADKDGYLRRSLQRVAEEAGVSKRSIQNWLHELERAGRVVKVNAPGKMGVFHVIRHESGVNTAKIANIGKVAERKTIYGGYGKKGAAIKASKKAAKLTQPVKPASPLSCNQLHPTGVQPVSPKQESKQNLLNKSQKNGRSASPSKGGFAPNSQKTENKSKAKEDCYNRNIPQIGISSMKDGFCQQGKNDAKARAELVKRFGGGKTGTEILFALDNETLEGLTSRQIKGKLDDEEIRLVLVGLREKENRVPQ